jgi:hypothetical protein
MHRSPFIFDCSRFIGRKKLQASQRECRKPCTIPLDLTRMKKIEAIIAPTEFEAVREGLRAAGILARPVITPAWGLQYSPLFHLPALH